MEHHAALARLRTVLREMGAVLVAYSGGVDSALLLTVAHAELGSRAAGLTAVSPSLPEAELKEASEYAVKIGARHIVIPSFEGERAGYQKNDGDRCFHCKSELFDLSLVQAEKFGFRVVADGVILDDLSEHRPGLRAAIEHQVRHPLVEAGFTKALVRSAALELGIPMWAKPAAPCLASRIAVGTRVTPGRLFRVARAESTIRALGFVVFRVRVHELNGVELARIEIDLPEWPRLGEPATRQAVLDACQHEGFTWITLDLAGYRRGSVAYAPDSAIAPNTSTPSTAEPFLSS